MVEDVLYLFHVSDPSALPKTLHRVLDGFGFQLCNIIFVLVVAPRQRHIQEVQDHEVEGPHVISPCQLLLEMCVETGVRDGAAELAASPSWHRHSVRLQVLFGEAEVNKVNARRGVSFSDREVRRLDVAMYKASSVHVVNAVKHLNE